MNSTNQDLLELFETSNDQAAFEQPVQWHLPSFSRTNVIMRMGRHPNLKFNPFVIAPSITNLSLESDLLMP